MKWLIILLVGKLLLVAIYVRKFFTARAVLPFLLADSQVVIVGPNGIKVTPINDIFQEQLQLKNGEFLVQIATDKKIY